MPSANSTTRGFNEGANTTFPSVQLIRPPKFDRKGWSAEEFNAPTRGPATILSNRVMVMARNADQRRPEREEKNRIKAPVTRELPPRMAHKVSSDWSARCFKASTKVQATIQPHTSPNVPSPEHVDAKKIQGSKRKRMEDHVEERVKAPAIKAQPVLHSRMARKHWSAPKIHIKDVARLYNHSSTPLAPGPSTSSNETTSSTRRTDISDERDLTPISIQNARSTTGLVATTRATGSNKRKAATRGSSKKTAVRRGKRSSGRTAKKSSTALRAAEQILIRIPALKKRFTGVKSRKTTEAAAADQSRRFTIRIPALKRAAPVLKSISAPVRATSATLGGKKNDGKAQSGKENKEGYKFGSASAVVAAAPIRRSQRLQEQERAGEAEEVEQLAMDA